MNFCDKSHRGVAYETETCPACDLLEATKTTHRKLSVIERLEDRVAVLEQREAERVHNLSMCNVSCTYETSQEKPGSYLCDKHRNVRNITGNLHPVDSSRKEWRP